MRNAHQNMGFGYQEIDVAALDLDGRLDLIECLGLASVDAELLTDEVLWWEWLDFLTRPLHPNVNPTEGVAQRRIPVVAGLLDTDDRSADPSQKTRGSDRTEMPR